MSRAEQVYIHNQLEPDQILQGNGKRYQHIKKSVFTDQELKEYYERNKKYIEYNLKEYEEREDAYLRLHGL